MCVDTHVPSGSRQGFALTVGNVLLGLGVTVLLGHTEIDDVNDVGCLGRWAADEEVVGLDVAVDEVLLVDCLHAREHLLGHHHHSLGGKPSVAVIEQVLQTGTKEVDHEDVVQALLAKVVNIGDAS